MATVRQIAWFLFASASTFALLPSQAQETALSQWKEFERDCILGTHVYDGPRAAKAIVALKEGLNSRNIFCSTYPPDLSQLSALPDGVRTSPDDKPIPVPSFLRLILTPTSKVKEGKPHPLCDLAEERFWKSDAPAEICYVIPPLRDHTATVYDGQYEGHDFNEAGFVQQIILPIDFWHGLLAAKESEKFLRSHEGLQYALAQHDLHREGRKTGKISSFYVSLFRMTPDYKAKTELELWTIPATHVALKTLSARLDKDDKDVRERIAFFTRRARQNVAFAVEQILQVQERIQKNTAAIEFRAAYDDLQWAQVSFDQKIRIFYLGLSEALKTEDDAKLRTRLETAVAETLKSLKNEEPYLKRVIDAIHDPTETLKAAITSVEDGKK